MSTIQAYTSQSKDSKLGQPSITELVSGIVADAQQLLRQQVSMIRTEVQADIRHGKEVAIYLGSGVVLAGLGGLFLGITLVFLLQWLAPSLPLWASWAIVGGFFLILGAIAFVVGRSLISSYNPLPEKSLTALEENLSWITHPNSPTPQK